MPVLKGWSKVHVKKGSMASPAFTVRPDSQYKLYESRVPGWIKNLRVTVKGSEETKIKLVNYSPDRTYPTIEYSISELMNECESDMPSDDSLYLSQYDPDNKIYTISMAPNPPEPYYATHHESFKIYIISPKDESTTIYSFSYKGIVLTSIDEFIRSYANIMNMTTSNGVSNHSSEGSTQISSEYVGTMKEVIHELKRLNEKLSVLIDPSVRVR